MFFANFILVTWPSPQGEPSAAGRYATQYPDPASKQKSWAQTRSSFWNNVCKRKIQYTNTGVAGTYDIHACVRYVRNKRSSHDLSDIARLRTAVSPEVLGAVPHPHEARCISRSPYHRWKPTKLHEFINPCIAIFISLILILRLFNSKTPIRTVDIHHLSWYVPCRTNFT